MENTSSSCIALSLMLTNNLWASLSHPATPIRQAPYSHTWHKLWRTLVHDRYPPLSQNCPINTGHRPRPEAYPIPLRLQWAQQWRKLSTTPRSFGMSSWKSCVADDRAKVSEFWNFLKLSCFSCLVTEKVWENRGKGRIAFFQYSTLVLLLTHFVLRLPSVM